jgi:hypothetical protein
MTLQFGASVACTINILRLSCDDIHECKCVLALALASVVNYDRK